MVGGSPILLTLEEDALGWPCGAGITPRAPGTVSCLPSPSPATACQSRVGAAFPRGGMGVEVCPQMPALYLELALILVPGHVGCDRRLEQTLLARRQPRMPARPPVAPTLVLLEQGTDSRPPIWMPFLSFGCLPALVE